MNHDEAEARAKWLDQFVLRALAFARNWLALNQSLEGAGSHRWVARRVRRKLRGRRRSRKR